MNNQKLVGLALIVLGAVFLLSRITGIGFPLENWWPLFPMAAGLVAISSGNWKGGLIIVAVFSVFLVNNLGVFDVDIWSLWPVALIALGAAVFLGSWGSGKSRPSDASEGIKVESIFSESNQSAAGKGFRGGSVSATFGSAEVDLRSAEATEGEATINVSVLFGGVNLRVPPDWAVDVRSSVFFGGIESKRPEPSEPRARLTITGSCWFGGIEITS